MSSRGIVAALTMGLLATMAPGSPASADADGTVVTSVALPGWPPGVLVGEVPMAVSQDGRKLVTVTTAGISQYLLGRRTATRLGTGTATPDDRRLELEVLPSGKFAYVTDTPYSRAPSRMQVFDLRRKSPRLVRTLTFSGLGQVHETEMTPDGRRLFLAGRDSIQILRLGNPARPTKGPSASEPRSGALKITPDGTRMVTAPASGAKEGAGNPVRVWDITRKGGPVVEREGTVVLPGREDTTTWIDELGISPQNDAVYVESGYCVSECDGSYATETTRLRFSDLATEAQTAEEPFGSEDFAPVVGAAGTRVYVRTGGTTDEDETPSRGLSWWDTQLTSEHAVAGVGNVRGLAVSPGGISRGTVYVAGRKHSELRIYGVRF